MSDERIDNVIIPPGMICICCYDDISRNNSAIYLSEDNSDEWMLYEYCSVCTKYLIDNSWNIYVNSMNSVDCRKQFVEILNKKCTRKLQTLDKNDIIKIFFDGKFNDSILKNSIEEEDVIKFNKEIEKIKVCVDLDKGNDIHFDNFKNLIKDFFQEKKIEI